LQGAGVVASLVEGDDQWVRVIINENVGRSRFECFILRFGDEGEGFGIELEWGRSGSR
jgi:hypothetical protein